MALEEPKEDDHVQNINGIEVTIDPRVLPQTEELTLDFQETPQGNGFVMLGLNNCC